MWEALIWEVWLFLLLLFWHFILIRRRWDRDRIWVESSKRPCHLVNSILLNHLHLSISFATGLAILHVQIVIILLLLLLLVAIHPAPIIMHFTDVTLHCMFLLQVAIQSILAKFHIICFQHSPARLAKPLLWVFIVLIVVEYFAAYLGGINVYI